ncbi:hypothetical protein [Kordia sp.]|uniref:hypothetical protein n=1 Tax=Kordia sp. TaxID=1965332 RepID=UPI003D6B47CD
MYLLSKSALFSILNIAQLFILLPLITIVFRYKRFNTTFKLIALLLVSAGVFALIGNILHRQAINNMVISHLYTIVEYICWSLVYIRLFDTKVVKKLVISSIFLVITFSIVNIFLWQPLDVYNSYSKTVESAFLLCFAIGWFYKIFVDQSIRRLEIHPVFWINSAVLIYFSGAFLLFVTNNFLLEIPLIEYFEAWALHGIFIMIHYLFISIGLWLLKHKKELR